MTERVSLSEAFFERRFLTILGLIAVAVGLYAIYWDHQAGKVKLRWAELVDEAKAKGLSVAAGSVETAGFPYRMELRIQDLSVTAPSALGDILWRTDHLTIHTLPYRMNHFIVDSPGPQNFSAGGAQFALATSDARASLVEAEDGQRRLAIDLQDPILSEEASAIGEAKRLQYHLAEDQGADAKQVAVEIDAGRLTSPPLGPVSLSAESDVKRDGDAGYDGTANVSIGADAAAINFILALTGLESRQSGGRTTLSFRIQGSKLFSGDKMILDLNGFVGRTP